MILNRIKKFNGFGHSYFKTHNLIFTKKFCESVNQGSLRFLKACQLFASVEANSKLTQKKEIYTNFLIKMISEDDKKEESDFKQIGELIKLTIPYLNLIQNKIVFHDKQDPIDINLRYQYTFELLINSYITEHFGVSEKEIQNNFIRMGDLANYFMDLHETEIKEKIDNEEFLSVQDILDYKEKIILAIGNKSHKEKLEIFSELISRCNDSLEILYIGRMFLNKLKIGIAEKNVINCVISLERQLPREKKIIFINLIKYLEKNIFKYQIYYPVHLKPAFSRNKNDEIDLSEELDFDVSLNPGTFVELQLGRLGMDLDQFMSTACKSNLKFLIETKYDGERSQLHFNEKEITMGSRSIQDQTSLYQNLKNEIESQLKEMNKSLRSYKKIKNFILDGEIVSYNHRTKSFCNFQELRMKKHLSEDLRRDTSNSSSDIEYYYIAFDILYFNDENVHHLPLEERKKILSKKFYNGSKFSHLLVEHGKIIDLQNSKLEEVKRNIINYFRYAKSINCEGLIGKELGRDSSYVFGKRRWYKLKTLSNSITDTLDLVPIAGFIGRGSKNNIFNSFLVAAYEADTDRYIGVCKLGTGFDQQDLIDIRDRFTPYLIDVIPDNYIIPRLVRPTVFFKPKEVWEVGFDSFSESQNYSIGKNIILQDKGLSLRFPRFIKFRNDKTIKSAASPDFITELYNVKNPKFNHYL